MQAQAISVWSRREPLWQWVLCLFASTVGTISFEGLRERCSGSSLALAVRWQFLGALRTSSAAVK